LCPADVVVLTDRDHRFALEAFAYDGSFSLRVPLRPFMADFSWVDQPQSTQFRCPCLREEQYRGSGDDDSFFSKMRKNILDWAQEHNHEVVEMNSIFSDHYVIHREKFNVSPDGLWNELGHKLAANAIRRRGIAQSLILSKG